VANLWLPLVHGRHPQQSKVSVFITSSLCLTTDKHLFQIPKQRFNRQSQYTIYIYIARNKILKTQKWAKYLGMCRLDEQAKSTVFDVRPRLGETPLLRRPRGSRPVQWSRRERNRARVRESERESAGRERVGRGGF
jgi:hypothetical protein